MEGFPERQGTEFDWFALDDAGEVAVFAKISECCRFPGRARHGEAGELVL